MCEVGGTPSRRHFSYQFKEISIVLHHFPIFTLPKAASRFVFAMAPLQPPQADSAAVGPEGEEPAAFINYRYGRIEVWGSIKLTKGGP